MLELSSQRWGTLASAGGNPSLVPQLIRALYEGYSEDTWLEVWEQLGHQWTLYPVAYAALPHLVSIALANNLSRTPDFLLSVGRLAAPIETIEPCPPDLASEFQESLNSCGAFALESAATQHDDPRNYATVLQAALALNGRAIPGVDLFFILAAGDPGGEIMCPRCSAELMVQFEDPVGVFAIDRRLKRVSHVAPITPRTHESGDDVFAWLTSLCRKAGDEVVIGWLRQLFGTSGCPKCGLTLNILAEVARKHEV